MEQQDKNQVINVSFSELVEVWKNIKTQLEENETNNNKSKL